MTNNNEKLFTADQLRRQAGAFRLLNSRIQEYQISQVLMPAFLQDDEDEYEETLADITRWVLDAHELDLKPNTQEESDEV